MNRHDEQTRLAYEHWVARGRPEGSPELDWESAGRSLGESSAADAPVAPARIDQPLEASFPSSDPPATHGADIVPSNADEKWQAAADAKRRGQTRKD